MRNKISVKSMLFLGLVALAFLMVPSDGSTARLKDRDGDGYLSNVDCNDRNAAINPGAAEVCDDGIDNNCDGDSDTSDSACATCADGDGDTYYAQSGCGTQVDCDDANADAYPGAEESCGNGVDEDCDGNIDEADACVVCTDGDGDGFFAANGCGTTVDCNDSATDVYPGAPELCDTVDNQCPGDSGYGFTDEVCSTCTDDDSDGYFASSGCGSAVDCEDDNSAVYPGAAENCNGIDDNCVNGIDEGCAVAAGDDSDGDGIPDDYEEDASGFVLSSEFQLWDEMAEVWINPPISIPGAASCPPGAKCLHPFIPDLFVIWKPLPVGTTKISIGSGDVSAPYTCNIFEFATTEANYGVWVLREVPGVTTTTRRIAQDPVVSTQKAVLLQELSSTGGSATGISQPGTIMVDGQGRAWIKTYKIEQNINDNCGPGPSCTVDIEGIPTALSKSETICHHCMKTASHEIWHVLSALNTADLHISSKNYIMSSAVEYYDSTYYIGDEFSAAGLNDPSFE